MPRAPRPPLDAESLRALALHYVGRYATTRVKLMRYLKRKLVERGWEPRVAPNLAAMAEDFAARGYLDDAAFAQQRAGALRGRGMGARRVDLALRADGIDADTRLEVSDQAPEDALAVAESYARRRRLGPYARTVPDPDQRRKHIAAMLRAGHSYAIARAIIDRTS